MILSSIDITPKTPLAKKKSTHTSHRKLHQNLSILNFYLHSIVYFDQVWTDKDRYTLRDVQFFFTTFQNY